MDGSRQNKFLYALRQITMEVANEHELNKAMALLVEHIRQTTEADCCSLYLVDDFRKRYRLVATDGLAKEAVGKATLKYGEGLVGVVGSTNEILNLADATSHPNFKYLPDVGEDEYVSFLGVPISNQGELLGVLVIQSKYKQIFGEQEESFMVTLAAQVGSTIARSRQENSIEEDVLQRVKGIASTGEIAIAKAMILQPQTPLEAIKLQKSDDPMMQSELFHQVIFQLQLEMDRTSLKMKEDDKSRALFGYMSGYGRFLDDPAFQDEVDNEINQGYLATSAVKLVYDKRTAALKASGEDEDVDLKDFAQIIVSRLIHATGLEFDMNEPVILVMENMPASLLGELSNEQVAGFIATSDSSSAHACILARDLDIPSVLGVNLNLADIEGRTVIIDGRNCEVILDPPDFVLDEYKQLINQNKEQSDLFAKESLMKAKTLDEREIHIGLNAGLNQKSNDIVLQEIDSIGLYRSEIAFMLCQTFPSEQMQYEWYHRLLERFSTKSVCVRTLDVGSDKGLSYLPSKEANPALGWRGIRILHDMPNLMYTQMRAMLRANIGHNNLEIMVPMVSRMEEVIFAKKALNEVYHELKSKGEDVVMPRFGVMIEVPSCVYLMDELSSEVDFFSIGSNDLIQYTLAVDRGNPKVSRFYDPFHPAVVRTLAYLSEKAKEHNKSITVCGEMAGDPLSALLLISLGFTSLSMNYSYMSRIKYMMRRVSFEELKALADKALHLTIGSKIKELYEQYAAERGLSKIVTLTQQERIAALGSFNPNH